MPQSLALMFKRGLILFGILGIFAGARTVLAQDAPNVTCPPTGFDTVADFDLSKYIAAPWFIQQQMVNSYQQEQDLYCVRARYVPEDPNDYKKGIVVQNYRNRGGINQNPGGSSGAGGSPCFGLNQLKAFPANRNTMSGTDASKVLVGPAPLAAMGRALLGDYWVVAVGQSKNETIGYDWGIVSAGVPNVTSTNGTGCRTGTLEMQYDPRTVNGVGLWLLSRKPVDPEGTATMRAKAEELGFDTSVLLNVTQEGCDYIQADPVCSTSRCGTGSRDFNFGNITVPMMPSNVTVRCTNGTWSWNGTSNTTNGTSPASRDTSGSGLGVGTNAAVGSIALAALLSVASWLL